MLQALVALMSLMSCLTVREIAAVWYVSISCRRQGLIVLLTAVSWCSRWRCSTHSCTMCTVGPPLVRTVCGGEVLDVVRLTHSLPQIKAFLENSMKEQPQYMP